ncbi:uncharacterized protein METZ01_LOCUS497594, partial [marine metagenome]
GGYGVMVTRRKNHADCLFDAPGFMGHQQMGARHAHGRGGVDWRFNSAAHSRGEMGGHHGKQRGVGRDDLAGRLGVDGRRAEGPRVCHVVCRHDERAGGSSRHGHVGHSGGAGARLFLLDVRLLNAHRSHHGHGGDVPRGGIGAGCAGDANGGTSGLLLQSLWLSNQLLNGTSGDLFGLRVRARGSMVQDRVYHFSLPSVRVAGRGLAILEASRLVV